MTDTWLEYLVSTARKANDNTRGGAPRTGGAFRGSVKEKIKHLLPEKPSSPLTFFNQGHQPVEDHFLKWASVDRTNWRFLGDASADYVNHMLHPPQWGQTVNRSDETLFEDLDIKGASPLGPVLSHEEINSILQQLDGVAVRDRYFPNTPHYQLSDRPKGTSFGHYDTKDIVRLLPLMEAINSPRIIKMATRFLGCIPTIEYLSLFWSFPDLDEPITSQIYHIDPISGRFLKFFIYLTDVGEDDGPNVIVQGSEELNYQLWQNRGWLKEHTPDLWPVIHNYYTFVHGNQFKTDTEIEFAYGKDKVVPNIGPAGLGFLGNTKGFHKGALPISRPRLMLMVMFSPIPLGHDEDTNDGGLFDAPETLAHLDAVHADELGKETLRYINRLLLRSS